MEPLKRAMVCIRRVMDRNKQVMYYVCCNFVICKFVFLYIYNAKSRRITECKTLLLGSS